MSETSKAQWFKLIHALIFASVRSYRATNESVRYSEQEAYRAEARAVRNLLAAAGVDATEQEI